MFQVPRVTLGFLGLLGTELRPVSFNKRQQNEDEKHFSSNIHGAHMFPQCLPVSHTGNIVSSVSFCGQDANYANTTRQGILTKNPCMQALAKILRARASEHSSNFCEQFEQSTNFASIFKLDGTIRYSYYSPPLR